MIGYEGFSALRLNQLFSDAVLESYPYYVSVDAYRHFDTEYQGGQWHDELIDGVRFFYPARSGDALGIAELWGARSVAHAAARDQPDRPPPLLVRGWAANADRVLAALELPVRMGADEAAVRALATSRVYTRPYPGEWYDRCEDVARGTLSTFVFVCRQPDPYHMQAVVHTTEGLLRLEVYHSDLIRMNESRKGGYDMCFGWLFCEP